MTKMNYVKQDDYLIPIYTVDKKSNTTYFFLHGLNSSSDFMLPILKYEHHYNVVAINLPGSKYFKKVDPEQISIEWWIKVANQVLEKIKTKNIVIVAHSMSGGIAFKLAKNPKVKKIIMVSTINPSIRENKSYYVLKSLISPNNTFSKIVGKTIELIGGQMKYKTSSLINSFSKKGLWHNLLKNYVLKEEFLDNLGQEYKNHKEVLSLVIGDNDAVIGTNSFVNFGKSLGLECSIIGIGHSPIKSAPKEMSLFLNDQWKSKKRHFWNRFMKIPKDYKEFINNYEGTSFHIPDETFEQIIDDAKKNIN
ncbi:alpha/beta fold hydrolase [Mycoplasma sp. Mirounga ES2805-ORL]|uniref:alpha/beta fold hydrolase n=1 Tax=Mycoplasma sp. Mirounga ES2805-ORL TaxID=754514 RepID=UPI00197C4A1E|nr:alpha/beta fold hydrolase [Mycoplasma sp. Mirounga ES2805-ORL]QSF13754.1 alpha/beta fold hydrolase [Mycoplasma sp. Mirounga ES2805-ORL]